MRNMHPLLYSLTIDRVLAGIRVRVPEFCGMRLGDRVLDVCCGTGAQTFCFAKMGIISWGIDVDPAMIEFAEKRRTRLRLANVFFQQASAMDLPFQEASFDHASISMGLHEKEAASRDRVISEMRRVVKKGGALVIVDYRVPYPRDAYGRVGQALEHMAGGDHYRCFREFIDDGGLDSLLGRHHLREEKREYLKRMPMVMVKVRNDRDTGHIQASGPSSIID
jgi:ubiquinone/menaquinone biosynthesis C-methylase UbiE